MLEMIDTVPFVIGVSIYNWKIVNIQHTTDINNPVIVTATTEHNSYLKM